MIASIVTVPWKSFGTHFHRSTRGLPLQSEVKLPAATAAELYQGRLSCWFHNFPGSLVGPCNSFQPRMSEKWVRVCGLWCGPLFSCFHVCSVYLFKRVSAVSFTRCSRSHCFFLRFEQHNLPRLYPSTIMGTWNSVRGSLPLYIESLLYTLYTKNICSVRTYTCI